MMYRRVMIAAAALSCLAARGAAVAEELPGDRCFDLTRGERAEATIVAPEAGGHVCDDAVALLTATIERWGGVAPKVVRLKHDQPLPAGDLIVLGTPQTSDYIAARCVRLESPVSRLPFIDRQGFAAETLAEGDTSRLVLAAATLRGVYNAAVYCRDFLLDAKPVAPGMADVFVRSVSVERSPRLAARGTYLLSLYGVAMKYTAEDWMKIIDRYAEDGMNRVYVWLSGHHPSKKFPHLYNVDSAKDTRLTVKGVGQLIRYCHDRDIEFHIGGGVFAWTAAHYLMEGHPEIAAVGAAGLCPSQPFARSGNREHFLEMYETWPEADGFMFEIRDEHGQCRCAECDKAIDAFGSKGYGRAEITWLQEFAREAWRRNPKLRFCWLIGYAEHAHDVAYYEQIREMSDPRFEWIDARVGLDLKGPWQLPGPRGEPHPLAFFSRRTSHWDPFYRLAVDDILTAARRSADEGLYGYVPAFEPGFNTASYYSDQVPLPVDALPYCLTGFAYREATWDPGLTPEQLKERVQRRYFSPDAPARFSDDMIYLRQFSFDHWQALCLFAKPRFGYSGETIEPLMIEAERQRVQKIADQNAHRTEATRLNAALANLADAAAGLKHMAEIEAAIKESLPTATPKTREGCALLQRFIDDTRRLFTRAVPDPAALSKRVE